MQTNPFNNEKYLQNSSVGASSASVEANSYLTYGLFVGPWYSAPLSEKISLDALIGGGYMFTSSPEITLQRTYSGQSSTFNISSGTGGGIAYKFGLGMRYNVSDKLCINADVSTLGMVFKYDSTVRTPTGNLTGSTTQDFSSLNIGVGFGYRLGVE